MVCSLAQRCSGKVWYLGTDKLILGGAQAYIGGCRRMGRGVDTCYLRHLAIACPPPGRRSTSQYQRWRASSWLDRLTVWLLWEASMRARMGCRITCHSALAQPSLADGRMPPAFQRFTTTSVLARLMKLTCFPSTWTEALIGTAGDGGRRT